jgi:synaptosomal-associated protein 29
MSFVNNKDNIEDMDDFTFLSHPRQGSSGYLLGNNDSDNDWEQKRRQLLEERRQIEERTLQNSKVSLGLIYETEKVGLSTAEELVRQREQLNNVDEKLDSMNAIMRVSQKHLTSMKSIFGGFKNYFSRNSDTNQPNILSSRPALHSESPLVNTIDTLKSDSNLNSARNHPALTQRGIDTNGFRLDDEELDEKPVSDFSLRSRQINRQLDQNLEEMDLGVGRLKNLALGLGNEIDDQNSLLDRITGKSERAEDTLQHQNRQMKRILK